MRSRSVLPYLAAIAIPTAITAAIGLASRALSIPEVGLLYLPAILVVAIYFGTLPSLLASGVATLQLDFFFLEPVHTLTIAHGDDLVTFGIFLLVSAVTAELAAGARDRALQAQRRANESYLLYELGKALVASRDLDTVLKAMTDRIVDVFRVDRCAVFVPGPSGEIRLAAETTSGARDRASEAVARYAFMKASGVFVPGRPSGEAGRQYIPLQVAGNMLGVMEVGSKPSGEGLDEEERRILTLFAAQASLAIDRARGEAESTRLRTLEETDRLKSSLLSAVSHDLRTPLSSIKASAAALLMTEAGWTDQEGRELLHAIEDESDRLNRLVGNLLDLSRIEAGTLRPALDWYDVEELADSVRRRGGALATDRLLSVEVESDLAAVRLDLVRIEAAVLNLIDNAARYTPPDTPILVRIGSTVDGVRIEVIDRGPGLTETQKLLVFDRFFRGREQADNTQRTGLGLGLAICRGIAEAHGGSIGVSETPGGGATFTVVIPQETATAETTA